MKTVRKFEIVEDQFFVTRFSNSFEKFGAISFKFGLNKSKRYLVYKGCCMAKMKQAKVFLGGYCRKIKAMFCTS